MKTIINGKKYDTDAAVICGIHRPYNSKSTLYRKDRNHFFLITESIQIFKSLCDYGNGSHIRTLSDVSIAPLDLQRALAWAEENLTPEEYERIVDETDDYDE